jgi:hypothetical protein
MSARELSIICDACKLPVDDEEGYVWIDYGEINRYETAFRAWEEETGTELVPGRKVRSFMDVYNGPKRVRWQAHHKACDPDVGAGSYTIEAERLRTWADLAEWTAQLMRLRWLSGTDWSDVLRSAAHSTGLRVTPVAPPTLNA